VHNFDLILTLTVSLAIAASLGYITHRLRLSPIVGYLIAGLVVGPYTPGFVANRELAEQLAEIGVILLMFGVGLEFHLKELLAVRRVAMPGAIIQSAATAVLAVLVLRGFGWGWAAGLVFGLAISVASTVVLIRMLSDNRDLHTPTGRIAVGWLVMEDLFTVLVLVALPVVFDTGSASVGRMLMSLGIAAIKIAFLVGFTFVVGGRVIPWLLGRVARTRSRELFTLTVLVLALGIAVGSAELFGVSMALGAFLAGMVVGRSEFSHRAASEALPMRDAFAVLFFVSVGMLFDPAQLLRTPVLVGAVLAVILLGKPLAAATIVLVLRYPFKTALVTAIALAQIGEFSFILATVGRQLGVLSEESSHILVAAAICSISLNPLLYRLVGPIDRWVSRSPRLWRVLNWRVATSVGICQESSLVALSPEHRAIVIGYGPVGRIITRILRQNAIEPIVIELNLETVHRLRAEGIEAVYGDAGRSETLQAAGAAQAGTLMLSSDGIQAAHEIIRVARELNPAIHILVRASYINQLKVLQQAGANAVISGEGEIALAFTETILRNLGATSDQIDRERELVRVDVLGLETPVAQATAGGEASGSAAVESAAGSELQQRAA
jgi:CPA2 family monovalent cation:H+ antiporter-2